jgi:hypothetical protein
MLEPEAGIAPSMRVLTECGSNSPSDTLRHDGTIEIVPGNSLCIEESLANYAVYARLRMLPVTEDIFCLTAE